jgi:hypothetical protein
VIDVAKAQGIRRKGKEVSVGVGRATVGVAAALAAAGASVALAAAAHKDPSGDSANGGPDIVSVNASKVAGGWIRFTVKVANRPNGVLNGDSLEIALDTDRKPSTGSNVTNSTDPKKQGADYLVFFFIQNGSLKVGGAKEKKGGSPSPLGSNTRGAVHFATWTLDVKAHAVKSPKKLNYWAVAYTTLQSGSADYAPNKGAYAYSSR